MQKILTPKQIKEADSHTIKKQKITSVELMERASQNCFNWIHKRLQGNPLPIKIFCGIGNNGGDGLVISRILQSHGYNVETFVVNFSKNRSKDFLLNYEKLKTYGFWPKMINSVNDLPKISENYMVIDAIFGIGLNKSPIGIAAETIKHINQSNAYVLSIDMPSGLFVDKPVTNKESVIKADQTLTFEVPKLAFYLPDNQDYSANTEIIKIGLDTNAIAEQNTNFYLTEKQNIKERYKNRTRFSHKGNFGHSLIIGGSYGKIGAVTLASKSCLKIGSGLVTAYIPKCGYNILQTAIPEVMVEVDKDKEIEFFNFKTKPTAIGIGIGLGKNTNTQKGFYKFLKNNKLPLVIDADALNILSENKEWLNLLPKNSILTPHPKELERLLGKWRNDYDKLEMMQNFSKKYQVILVLKGHYTAICQSKKIYFNTTGNPALATAGSGDVLTGLITGLLAQKYTPIDACITAVFLHGKTADIAITESETEATFIASNIIKYLSKAIKSLFNKNE
ncbi:MAG TPA: NAD(P)H-hydrate dehydratase [Flavobacteriia bacterium]|nr:NAD(P)H-hydrate dehydratase [Flavobacteriia bacterium]